jgi:two-component system chemotaxis response regulator CheB
MKTKVLVVDDSAFMRKVISDLVNSSSKLEVVGTAKNGKDAIEKVKTLKPDVLTLDVEMPVMDGIAALEVIMKEMPMPVLMLSSITKEGAEATIKSLELGAIDFITKPSSIFKVNTEDMQKELVEKILVVANVKYRKPRSVMERKKVEKPQARESLRARSRGNGHIDKIIAIGTSTGGPRALQSVIPNIPGDINASIVIVQHMPAGFTKSLAERMNTMSQLSVKEAEDGESLKAGFAYIAPGDSHLRIVKSGKDYKIKLDKGELVSGHRPSVDAMMYSIADMGIKNIIGVIMTGMGSDGARGLENVKQMNRGYIIAQDEESCVVYGMPKSTVDLGVVDKIVPLESIANEIIKAMEV